MDRFDLEQQILECWRVTDDMKIVGGMVGSGSSDDDVINALNGLTVLYEQKFTALFATFEALVRSRNIS